MLHATEALSLHHKQDRIPQHACQAHWECLHACNHFFDLNLPHRAWDVRMLTVSSSFSKNSV